MFQIDDIRAYMTKHQPVIVFKDYTKHNESFSDLVAQKLGIKHYFKGKASDDTSVAFSALQSYEWLFKLRFEYQNLRVKVPLLHKVKDGYEIFFIYPGTFPKNNDSLYYQAILWVLKNNHIHVTDCHIIYLNEKYTRKRRLDPQQLFVISDTFYNRKHRPTKKIKDVLLEKRFPFKSILKKMALQKEKLKPIEDFENNSIFTLIGNVNHTELYQKGIYTLKDVANLDMDLQKAQYAQVKADLNGGFFVDKNALYTWFSKLKGPISFLDFEWETYSIPPYKGMKPMQSLVFQYSLHINDGQKLKHKQFIGFNDCRQKVLKHLLKDLPSKGSIICYNMLGAEKLRLSEMIEQFPKYEKQLKSIMNRLVDLEKPFKDGMVYDIRMAGKYSVKTIMNFLQTDNYDTLQVQDGLQALVKYRQIKQLKGAQKEEVLLQLKQYCTLDTYSLFVIYCWLKNML